MALGVPILKHFRVFHLWTCVCGCGWGMGLETVNRTVDGHAMVQTIMAALKEQFLAGLDKVQEELLYYPRRWRLHWWRLRLRWRRRR